MSWNFARLKSLPLPWIDQIGAGPRIAPQFADLIPAGVTPMATLNGTSANDTLKGTSADDTFNGRGGSDTFVIKPGGGHDTFADSGSASGWDRVIAKGTDQELGLASGFGPQSGVEEISANGFAGVYIAGTDGLDILDFSATVLTGITKIVGGLGRDIITGSAGNDDIRGDNQSDHLFGGDGDDELFGGSRNDLDPDENSQHGADGDDTLEGGGGNDLIAGGADNDLLLGGNGNDTLLAATGNDVLSAGAGNDSAEGWEGDDQIDGGSGNDDLTGGDGNDTLTGGTGDDTLSGNGSNDAISGGGGNDLIRASEGLDTLTGDGGADTFQFAATGQDLNLISDFKQGTDTMDFSRLDADENTVLVNDDFLWGGAHNGAEANSITFHISGGTTTVFVDVNGDQVADMTLTLTGALTLTASDFLL